MRRSIRASGAISAILLVLAGCFPYGFKGGGLDPALRTYAVVPLENKTTTPGLERELTELLSAAMRRMGRREVPEGEADILVTGAIARYDPDIPIAFSADPNSASGTRRKLQIALDITITAQGTQKRLYERRGVVGEGQYAESAESEGRREAFTKLINEIVNGIQSQW